MAYPADKPRFNEPCAYRQERPAVGKDHVIPKSLQRKCRKQGQELPSELCGTVPACLECNVRKSTRKLVPPSWAEHIPALKEAIPGQWRVWRGDPKSKSFTAVHR